MGGCRTFMTKIDPSDLAVTGRILAGDEGACRLTRLLAARTGPVCAELRRSGRLLAAGWQSAADQWQSLCKLLRSLRQESQEANELLVGFTGNPRVLNLRQDADWRRATMNMQRGLSAYEIRLEGATQSWLRLTPFAAVAQNRTFEKLFEQFAQTNGWTIAEARRRVAEAREYDTEHYWIELDPQQTAVVPLYRGNRLVTLSDINRALIIGLERSLRNYLICNVQPDGRMTYLYYPSRGCEDVTKNNSIRQWMATRALALAYRREPSPELLSVLRRNVGYNIQTMYRNEHGLGLIEEGGKVKLGAVALAALTLQDSPFAGKFAEIVQSLQATVTFLWQEHGEFRTFYRPVERRDCQNFYPGEALLLWSKLIVDKTDASLVERFWRSFDFYQRWHLANRNPAFIPWHTQAYRILWQFCPNERLAHAIFNMNDWLLAVQQWETAPRPDCQGRFYDPYRPFGPPHASSTAVYLEGLTDALALAKELSDEKRRKRYRIAVLRGLRSIAQLTYKDNSDMFYVTKRNRVRGGVRTTEYNNAVRIDNVQHSLMAVQKALDVLSDDDLEMAGAAANLELH
jgi:hypothetical protein